MKLLELVPRIELLAQVHICFTYSFYKSSSIVVTLIKTQFFYPLSTNLLYWACWAWIHLSLRNSVQTQSLHIHFVHLNYTIFTKCIQFCIFNVHNFSWKVNNYVYSMYTFFQRLYAILYIKHTQFFKEYILFCIFNIHNFLKNVHNSVHSMYTIYQTMKAILWIQRIHFYEEFTQFCIFNVYNFSKNVHKIFKQCVQFYTFNVTIFQRMYIILYF